jgi:hypothetical protein
LKILNLVVLCSLVFLTACQKQNQPQADIEKAQHAIDSQVTASQVKSEAEVEIPATVSVPKKELEHATFTYPEALVKQVAEAQQHCQTPGKVEMGSVIKTVDLIGDEQPEYIYEPDSIVCAEDGVFRGHGGDQLVIYQSKDHKTIQEIFNSSVFAYQVIQNQPKAVVQVEVGGGYCGQNMDEISRAEAITCKRNLEWDDASKQLKMGKIQLDERKANAE